MSRSILNRLCMENIDFQTDSFGKDLELIITEAQARYLAKKQSSSLIDKINGKDNANYSDLRVRLEVLIFSRLGIKTKIDLNTPVPGAIMPFLINPNNVLLKKMFRGDLDKIDHAQDLLVKSLGSKAKGTVDIKSARVTGMFSEYEHPLWLGLAASFSIGCTPGQITAILLHELGHGFTFYEYSNRVSTTNQILAEYVAATLDKKNSGKRQYALKELEAYGAITEEECDEMLRNPDTVFSNAMFLRYIQFITSTLPNSRYDEVSSEQLADNFANRFGYGKELITGLDKLYTQKLGLLSPEKSIISKALFYLYEIMATVSVLGTLARIITVATKGNLSINLIYTGFYMLTVMLAWWNITGADNEDMTYDKLKIRYTRIRSDMIHLLKDKDLDKKTIEYTIDVIADVDKIIKNTMIHNNLLTIAKNILIPSHRSTKGAIYLQQQLELLASNDLFVKAAELKTI